METIPNEYNHHGNMDPGRNQSLTNYTIYMYSETSLIWTLYN